MNAYIYILIFQFQTVLMGCVPNSFTEKKYRIIILQMFLLPKETPV